MSIIRQAVEKLTERDARKGLANETVQGAEGWSDGRRGAAPRHSGRESATLVARGSRVDLDRGKLIRAGLLVPDAFAGQTAAEFRRIKRPLVQNASGAGDGSFQHGNLIMITSALPGAGKTFTSMNLALSMSIERDYSVLLVDGDVAKPHVTRVLGLSDRPGLLEYLRDESWNLASLIVQTDQPSLAVLPAGRPGAESTELLSSRRMLALSDELAASRDSWIVIFDSPPLLATSEAQVLAGIVDQVVVVIEADESPRHAVQQAVEMLDPAKAVNLVMNKVRRSALDGYDGYYGAYYGHTDP